MMSKRGASVGLNLMVVLYIAMPSMATVYTVGDSSGWTLGVDYASWSSSKSFILGDSLVFNYGSGHTVDEVSQKDYTACTIGNPINTDNKGSTTILLQTPGTHFFICGVIGHCATGMKLSVNVLPSAGSTSSTTNSTSSTTGCPPTTFPTPSTATPLTIPDYVASSGCLSSFYGALVVIFVTLNCLIFVQL
ncbi:hypothetical protein RND81_01G176400 [Saponaria officinalis]|uniref:Phytocyanin domain-containing protein n=1 Tax=Saponaria officinalis TaxID=3572 RepID=A0AAW1NFI1_SAPOF